MSSVVNALLSIVVYAFWLASAFFAYVLHSAPDGAFTMGLFGRLFTSSVLLIASYLAYGYWLRQHREFVMLLVASVSLLYVHPVLIAMMMSMNACVSPDLPMENVVALAVDLYFGGDAEAGLVTGHICGSLLSFARFSSYLGLAFITALVLSIMTPKPS